MIRRIDAKKNNIVIKNLFQEEDNQLDLQEQARHHPLELQEQAHLQHNPWRPLQKVLPVSALDLWAEDLRHQAKDQLQLRLKPPVMVLEEARVLLEEEVEEKKNLIQITVIFRFSQNLFNSFPVESFLV